jgi:hypothetical protein
MSVARDWFRIIAICGLACLVGTSEAMGVAREKPPVEVIEGAATAVHAICPNAAIHAPNGAAGPLTAGGAIAVPMIVDCDREQSSEATRMPLAGWEPSSPPGQPKASLLLRPAW